MRRYHLAEALHDHDQPGEINHLALTTTETLCSQAITQLHDATVAVDTPGRMPDLQHIPHLCDQCRTRLAEEQQLLASPAVTHPLAWQPALAPHGADMALAAEAALDAEQVLTLLGLDLWPVDPVQRPGELLRQLALLVQGRDATEKLIDQLVLAVRDRIAPGARPSWETIGEALGVKGTAVRHRYQRAAQTFTDRMESCPWGCGEVRPAARASGAGAALDAWKWHELDCPEKH